MNDRLQKIQIQLNCWRFFIENIFLCHHSFYLFVLIYRLFNPCFKIFCNIIIHIWAICIQRIIRLNSRKAKIYKWIFAWFWLFPLRVFQIVNINSKDSFSFIDTFCNFILYPFATCGFFSNQHNSTTPSFKLIVDPVSYFYISFFSQSLPLILWCNFVSFYSTYITDLRSSPYIILIVKTIKYSTSHVLIFKK